MIHSMTGYGSAEFLYQDKKIHIEIKALNSKNVDIITRTSSFFREKEIEIRKIVGEHLERGKIEFNLWIENENLKQLPQINLEMVKTYQQQFEAVAQQTGLSLPQNLLEIIARMPDFLQTAPVEMLTEDLWERTIQNIRVALEALEDFRKQEGEALADLFKQKVSNIKALLLQVEPHESVRVEKIKARLLERLQQVKEAKYDEGRLEQEMIYYIEKLDISEEKQRLSTHLDYFIETMNKGKGQGKKLGFIAQEMGREINTLGSKSNQAEMQALVVQMKDELEQIKEQVLNVL